MSTFDLLIIDKNKTELQDLFFSQENQEYLKQLVKEYYYLDELQKYRLNTDHKLLLYGDSGCGKTTTAKALAHALGRNIFTLNLANFISSRIGDTAKNLKAVFDRVAREKAVLFLDEFDQVGKMRGNDDKDVGEMRRLVNTLIQLMDYFPQDAILIAATNHPELIDMALMRRFQLKLKFDKPTQEQLDVYYDTLLSRFPERFREIERKYGYSYAEAKDYTYTAIKKHIIQELELSSL